MFIIMNCTAFIIILTCNNSVIISVIKHKAQDFLPLFFLFFSSPFCFVSLLFFVVFNCIVGRGGVSSFWGVVVVEGLGLFPFSFNLSCMQTYDSPYLHVK